MKKLFLFAAFAALCVAGNAATAPQPSASLSGNNTFTGTNTFTGNVNTCRVRVLWQTNNLFFAAISPTNSSFNANCTATATNILVNTPFATNLFTATLPPLTATNSRVLVDFAASRTNTIPSGSGVNTAILWTLGTNAISIQSAIILGNPTWTPYKLYSTAGLTVGSEIFRNEGSFSVQQPIPTTGNAALFSTQTNAFIPASHVDTSNNWTLGAKLGWASGANATATNIMFDRIVIYEVIPPL